MSARASNSTHDSPSCSALRQSQSWRILIRSRAGRRSSAPSPRSPWCCRASGWIGRSRRSRTSWTSNPRTFSATRGQSPISPRLPARTSICPIHSCARFTARRSCTTSDGLGSPTPSWTSAGRSAPASGSESASNHTSPSACSSDLQTLAPLGAIAVQHRERLDGSGYPRGIGGSSISLAARILGAADLYHAIREPRPHRPARSADERQSSSNARQTPATSTARWCRACSLPPATPSRRRKGPADLTEREVDLRHRLPLRPRAAGRSPWCSRRARKTQGSRREARRTRPSLHRLRAPPCWSRLLGQAGRASRQGYR